MKLINWFKANKKEAEIIYKLDAIHTRLDYLEITLKEIQDKRDKNFNIILKNLWDIKDEIKI